MRQEWLRAAIFALGVVSLLFTAFTTVNYANGIETIRSVRIDIQDITVHTSGEEETPVVVELSLSSDAGCSYRVVSLNYATLKLGEQSAGSCGKQRVSVEVPTTGAATISLGLELGGSYATAEALAEALDGNPQRSLSTQLVVKIPKRREPAIVDVKTRGGPKQDE